MKKDTLITTASEAIGKATSPMEAYREVLDALTELKLTVELNSQEAKDELDSLLLKTCEAMLREADVYSRYFHDAGPLIFLDVKESN